MPTLAGMRFLLNFSEPTLPLPEQAAAALFGLLQTCTWPSTAGTPETWGYSSRRLRLAASTDQQPAMYLASHTERVDRRSRGEGKVTMNFSVVVYHRASMDPTFVGDTKNNLIISSIKETLEPDEPGMQQTLGGLVHSCMIEGEIMKDPGDINDQAVILIPVRIILPQEY